LQQTRLDVVEKLPAFSVVRRPMDLATQAKPALCPSRQAFGRSPLSLLSGMGDLVCIPSVEAGFDIALEYLSQIVVAVKLVFVGNASESLNSFKYGHHRAPAGDKATGTG
jgi:hypothetical protein